MDSTSSAFSTEGCCYLEKTPGHDISPVLAHLISNPEIPSIYLVKEGYDVKEILDRLTSSGYSGFAIAISKNRGISFNKLRGILENHSLEENQEYTITGLSQTLMCPVDELLN